VQIGLAGVAPSVVALMLRAAGFVDAATALAFALGSGVAAALAASWSLRQARVDQALAHAAAAQQPGAAPTHRLPALGASRSQVEALAAVQQMLDRWRAHVADLVAQNDALGRRLTLRTRELTTLQGLSTDLARSSDVHQLADDALAALLRTLDEGHASIWVRDHDLAGAPVVLLGHRSAGVPSVSLSDELGAQVPVPIGARLARSQGQQYDRLEAADGPVVENQARQGLLAWLWTKVTDDSRVGHLYRDTRSWMAVPLRARERVLGVLRVDHPSPDRFGPEQARLLGAVAGQAALALRQVRLMEREREIAVISERNRIARELHDAVSQSLFAAHMLARSMHQATGRDDMQARALNEQAGTLERLIRGTLSEMRLLMFELRPDALESAPLAELLQHAIGALGARDDITVTSHVESDLTVAPKVRVELYRIAQEALSNVARHSAARHAGLHWRRVDGSPTLRIVDDGIGFDPNQPHPGHFGLGHMAQRAADIGARWQVVTAPGEGTEVIVRLPAEAATLEPPAAQAALTPSAMEPSR
jgi:signal transduction histidine kinase